ncbi:hypothetical protein KEM52_006413 [Ascosphaera acerosa]|nr:hypothetical protein KEM52_006413 [Ascosphaera acerosa]
MGIRFHLRFWGLPHDEYIRYRIHTGHVKDGSCASAGPLFDVYQSGGAGHCDVRNPATWSACAIGDLSGKHGPLPHDHFMTEYLDDFLSLNTANPAFFGDKSLVVTSANGTVLNCGNFSMAWGVVLGETTARPSTRRAHHDYAHAQLYGHQQRADVTLPGMQLPRGEMYGSTTLSQQQQQQQQTAYGAGMALPAPSRQMHLPMLTPRPVEAPLAMQMPGTLPSPLPTRAPQRHSGQVNETPHAQHPSPVSVQRRQHIRQSTMVATTEDALATPVYAPSCDSPPTAARRANAARRDRGFASGQHSAVSIAALTSPAPRSFTSQESRTRDAMSLALVAPTAALALDPAPFASHQRRMGDANASYTASQSRHLPALSPSTPSHHASRHSRASSQGQSHSQDIYSTSSSSAAVRRRPRSPADSILTRLHGQHVQSSALVREPPIACPASGASVGALAGVTTTPTATPAHKRIKSHHPTHELVHDPRTRSILHGDLSNKFAVPAGSSRRRHSRAPHRSALPLSPAHLYSLETEQRRPLRHARPRAAESSPPSRRRDSAPRTPTGKMRIASLLNRDGDGARTVVSSPISRARGAARGASSAVGTTGVAQTPPARLSQYQSQPLDPHHPPRHTSLSTVRQSRAVSGSAASGGPVMRTKQIDSAASAPPATPLHQHSQDAASDSFVAPSLAARSPTRQDTHGSDGVFSSTPQHAPLVDATVTEEPQAPQAHRRERPPGHVRHRGWPRAHGEETPTPENTTHVGRTTSQDDTSKRRKEDVFDIPQDSQPGTTSSPAGLRAVGVRHGRAVEQERDGGGKSTFPIATAQAHSIPDHTPADAGVSPTTLSERAASHRSRVSGNQLTRPKASRLRLGATRPAWTPPSASSDASFRSAREHLTSSEPRQSPSSASGTREHVGRPGGPHVTPTGATRSTRPDTEAYAESSVYGSSRTFGGSSSRRRRRERMLSSQDREPALRPFRTAILEAARDETPLTMQSVKSPSPDPLMTSEELHQAMQDAGDYLEEGQMDIEKELRDLQSSLSLMN